MSSAGEAAHRRLLVLRHNHVAAGAAAGASLVVATAAARTHTTEPLQLINRPACTVQQRGCALPLPAEALACCLFVVAAAAAATSSPSCPRPSRASSRCGRNRNSMLAQFGTGWTNVSCCCSVRGHDASEAQQHGRQRQQIMHRRLQLPTTVGIGKWQLDCGGACHPQPRACRCLPPRPRRSA